MNVPLRLLIVEDSEDDALLLTRGLQRGGYEVKYERVDTAAALASALDRSEWDLIISDHSMPHFSGKEALKVVRSKNADLPFIFISGTIGEDAAVAALKNGAQDYLMKNNLVRLVPAVQRALEEVQQRRQRANLERQVQQLQKFEAIGRLAGGIAHDFNNVLTAIRGWAELELKESPQGSKSQERLQNICAQAHLATGLTSQLLAFARRQFLERRRIDLNALVDEGTSLLQRVIGEDIELRIVLASDLQVTLADPVQIDQVLMNLCLNARDAMPKGGQLIIETRNVEIDEDYARFHTEAKPGSYVLLSVSDTGMGMDATTIEHIFEPFFTTKEVGKGTGLGLATVFGIIKQHNGFINVYSELGKGTTFRVYLPATSGTAEKLNEQVEEGPLGGTETLLLAEDNENLRELAQETLGALGYRLILAANGIEAVDLYRANADSIDAVVLDVVMPSMSGPDAYLEMIRIQPRLPAVFTTGYTAEAAAVSSLAEQGAWIVQKPYGARGLSRAIRGVLEQKKNDS